MSVVEVGKEGNGGVYRDHEKNTYNTSAIHRQQGLGHVHSTLYILFLFPWPKVVCNVSKNKEQRNAQGY